MADGKVNAPTGKPIDVAGLLNAATTEGWLAKAIQTYYGGKDKSVEEELDDIEKRCYLIENEEYLWALVDAKSVILGGVKRKGGEWYIPVGTSDDMVSLFKSLQKQIDDMVSYRDNIYHIIENDTYLLAIMDKNENCLGGITKSGRWVIPDGISDEAQRHVDDIRKILAKVSDTLDNEIVERKAIIRTDTGSYVWAIADKNENIWLAGLKDGSVLMPVGIPEEVKPLLKDAFKRLERLESFIKTAENLGVLGAFIDSFNNTLCQIWRNGDFEIVNKLKTQTGMSISVEETEADTLYHIVDKDGLVLFNIKRNGQLVGGNGIILDGLKSGISFVDSQKWLFAIVDNNRNVLGGIDKNGATFANSISGVFEANVIEDYNYLLVFRDFNGNILFGVRKDGSFFANSVIIDGIPTKEENPTFLYVILDKNRRVLWGIMRSGTVYQPKGIPEEVREHLEELNKQLNELRGKVENSEEIKINNKAIDKVMLNGNAGRGYLGNVALQEPGMTDYCIIMMYGQSLSNGSENPAGFNDPVVDGCLMLGDNVWTTDGSVLNGLRVGGSVREDGVATGTRQDTIVSTVNTFVSLYKKERPWDKNTKFIACSLGVGGRTVAQLSGNMYSDKKNTTRRYPMCNEQQLEDRVRPFFESVKAIADAEGKTISLSAVFWKQGESDYGTGYIGKTYEEWRDIVVNQETTSSNTMSGSKDAYKKGLTILKEDIWALAKEIFGDDQQNSPVFLPYSVCGTYINNAYQTINDATYEMANEQDDVVQVGPTYVTPDYEGGHLAMNGYRWFGEYCAKALYYVFLKHMDFRPLQPYGFDVKDNKVYIYINPIVPPLRIDTYTNDSIYKNYGFSVRMGTVSQLNDNKSMTSGGLLQTITDVSIVENCIVLTCGNIEKFEGAIEVSYAGQGENGYSGHNQGAGNIRDSDTWAAKYQYRNDMADHGSRRSFNVWASVRVATESDLTDYEAWNSATTYAYGDMCLITNATNGVTYLVKSMKDDNKNLSPFSSGTTWRTAYLWNGSTKATEEELLTLEYWDAAFASSTGYDYGDKVLFDIIEVDGPVVLTNNYGDAAGTVKNKNVPFGRVNYHTTDVKGNMIIDKPYPMQNWLLNFYKRIIIG